MMNIINLKHEPQHLPLLARWHQSEWGYLNPEETIEKRIERMQANLNADFIPGTWVALTDQLAGSAAIVVQDMDTHQQFSPWLASVYVCPAQRQQGIGSALVTHVMRAAAEQGIQTLYLFTPDQAPFYQKLGWTTIEQPVYRGHQVSVMKVALNT